VEGDENPTEISKMRAVTMSRSGPVMAADPWSLIPIGNLTPLSDVLAQPGMEDPQPLRLGSEAMETLMQ
jgi:hypothetical protein